MTVIHDEDIWIDPSDAYRVRAVRFPYSVEPEGGGCIMAFSFHTGRLWCERLGQEHHGQRSREVYIGPLVVTHDVFAETLLECGYGPDTHYLLGRKHGGFPSSARQSTSGRSSVGRIEEGLAEVPARYHRQQAGARCYVTDAGKVGWRHQLGMSALLRSTEIVPLASFPTAVQSESSGPVDAFLQDSYPDDFARPVRMGHEATGLTTLCRLHAHRCADKRRLLPT